MKKPRITILQALVHLAGWTPLAFMLYNFFTDNLTANPIQAIEQQTGLHALTFLLYSLACTPLAAIAGWKELSQRRKALGNYGFLYAALHVIAFFGLDYGFDLPAVWADISNKGYILIGGAAFILLLPLAITSFNYWMKRLGKNWKKLHRLAYVIPLLVVWHYLMVSKADLSTLQGNLLQPLSYGAIAIFLLVLRIPPVKKALIAWRERLSSRP